MQIEAMSPNWPMFCSIVHICVKLNVILSSMQIEMMSESIDETLDKDEAEEETEELTNQVEYWHRNCSIVFLYRSISIIILI